MSNLAAFVPQFRGPLDARACGTLSERATRALPNYAGQMYFATDTSTLYVYSGSTWLEHTQVATSVPWSMIVGVPNIVTKPQLVQYAGAAEFRVSSAGAAVTGSTAIDTLLEATDVLVPAGVWRGTVVELALPARVPGVLLLPGPVKTGALAWDVDGTWSAHVSYMYRGEPHPLKLGAPHMVYATATDATGKEWSILDFASAQVPPLKHSLHLRIGFAAGGQLGFGANANDAPF